MQRRTPETKNNQQVPHILMEQEKAKVDVLKSKDKDMKTSKETRLDLSSEPSLYMRNSLARKYSSRSFDLTPRSGKIV